MAASAEPFPFAPSDGPAREALEALAEAVNRLASLDTGQLSAFMAAELMKAGQRLVNRIQAFQVRCLVVIDQREFHKTFARSLPEYTKNCVNDGEAGWRLTKVAKLIEHLPALALEFDKGTLNLAQIYACTERLGRLPKGVHLFDDHLQVVEYARVRLAADACMAAYAPLKRADQLKLAADHILAALDPDGHQARVNERAKGNNLRLRHTPERTFLSGGVDPVLGQILENALRHAGGSPVEALKALAEHYLDCTHTPQRRSAKYHLVVIAHADTVAGTVFSPAAYLTSGATIGYQDLARTMASGTDATRVIVGPAGCVRPDWPGLGLPAKAELILRDTDRLTAALTAVLDTLPVGLGGRPSELLDVGRTERLHTPAMRIGLLARDGATCVRPGCDALATELHHLTAWNRGGYTRTGDAAGLCKADHQRVTEDGWVVYRDLDHQWQYAPPRPGFAPPVRWRNGRPVPTGMGQTPMRRAMAGSSG